MSDGEQRYEGRDILVKFDATKCIHARNCVLGRPDVFVPNAPGEWIQPDGARAEEIAAVARACPSGAITYELHAGAPEAAPLVNTARLRENGPLVMHAEMEIEGHGAALRAALCRCGHSKNKPFCDGTHLPALFVATGEPPIEDSKPLAERAGKLSVKPLPDGPLLVSGNLEVVTGSGRTVNRVEKCALCRCGASDNKPYCDGSHARGGFRSA
jgi:CDGSH-type Zn-finger protein/uncharacterized Fe-S cluster protein YjdI